MTARWYAVHAYSNFENKVAESIREQAKQRGLGSLFEDILVPKEKVVEVRRGRKVDAAQVLPRLRAGENGIDRRSLSPDQEHAESHRLPRFGQ
jgi:transcription antitermination factor NusG